MQRQTRRPSPAVPPRKRWAPPVGGEGACCFVGVLMAEPWIRVHARLPEKRVVARCAETLRIDHYKAMGHIVAFWGGVSLNVTGGMVGDVPDALLERWAGWSGKRGAFAQWVREQHLDDEGRVNEWLDYAGALESRRAKERQRLHDKREMLRNSTHGVAQQTRNAGNLLQPARAERDETKRDETKEQDQEQVERERAPDPPWVSEAIAQWSAKVGHTTPAKVRKALGPLVKAHGWESVSRALADYVVATPGSKAKLEWFAERGAYWVRLSGMEFQDQNGRQTERYRVVIEGKAA